jgi:hypothetical protein
MWIRWIPTPGSAILLITRRTQASLEVCVYSVLFYIFPFLLFEQAWQAGDKPLRL